MRAILILIQTREIQILIAVTHQCSLIRQIAPSLAGQNPPRTMTRRLGAEPGWSGESLESILNLDYPLRSPSPGQSPAPRPAPRHIRADDESGPDPTTPNASPCWDRCAGTAASGCGTQGMACLGRRRAESGSSAWRTTAEPGQEKLENPH